MKKKKIRQFTMDLERLLPRYLLGLLTLLTLFMLCAQLLLHIPAAARHVSPIADMEGWTLDLYGH